MPAKPARKIHLRIIKDRFTDKPSPVMEAVDQLVDFVETTLGPKIKHILVDFGYKTELMDDGVSIAEEFELDDEFQDAVISYVKEAARKTDVGAGDGTTTTMVMLRRLLALALASGKPYPQVRDELQAAALKAAEQLKERSVICDSLDMLRKVARTSMDDVAAADVVAEVVWKTGPKGAVTITEHASRTIEYERLEGFTLGRGFVARGMVNDKENNLFLAPNKNFTGPVAIAVVEQLISSEADIVPILEAAEARQFKNLAIFCPNLIGEALGIVALNVMKGAYNIVAVPLPGQGEKTKDYVQDICTTTGASVPVGDFKPADLGIAESVRASTDDTTVAGGKGEPSLIQAAIADLQRKSADSRDPYEQEYLHQRQARLMGGVVMIKVGGVTETELRLRLKKVEDAVNACKCALEEGVSPGGGMALRRIKSGSDMLDAALREVSEVVLENAEMTMPPDLDDMKQTFNVIDGQVGDFLEVGVVDATKVLRTAVENAVSIATILYSASGIITSKRED
jgi:chaperonin GroEL